MRSWKKVGVATTVVAVAGFASIAAGQTLTARSSQINYNYVFGAGGDAHSGGDLRPRSMLLLADMDQGGYTGSTQGVLNGTPYTAGASSDVRHEYSVDGTTREIVAIRASGSSNLSASASGAGIAVMHSSSPGNEIILNFRVQIAVPYRLSGSIALTVANGFSYVALQRFDGITWQHTFNSAFMSGAQGAFDVTGTLMPGEYRMRSVLSLTAQANQTRTGTYSYVLDVPERGSCFADIDDGSGTGTPDGGITIDDLLYYLFIFENGLIDADVDDGSGLGRTDGGVTIDDLLFYLLRFEQGC